MTNAARGKWGRVKKLPVWFSREEIFAFFEAIDDDKYRFIFKMLYYHGLRLMELYNLKTQNVRLDENIIIIRESKGGGERVVPIAPTILPWLEKVMAHAGTFLVDVQRDSLLSWEREMQRKIKHYAHCAGMKNWYQWTPHKLRHSYASHVYQQTGDIIAVQKLLGHKDVSTTMIYSHLGEKEVRRVVEETFKN